MGTLNRKELDHLERRDLQLTILAAVFVLVLAGGLAAFMYPLVFLHPVGNKWTLRVAFFGFCALTVLFVSYLLERQRTVRQLKQQILAELERNVTLQQQCPRDIVGHVGITSNPVTLQWVENALERNGPADPNFAPSC